MAAALLLGACAAPAAGARSRPLADAKSLAGLWTLTVQGAAACKLLLTAEGGERGYRAAAQGGCPIPIAQWRPVPDGMELAAADGLTLILLEPAGGGAYRGYDAERRPARLVR